ncbi:MAG: DUF6807 family protein [Pirellulaceae bacterium]
MKKTITLFLTILLLCSPAAAPVVIAAAPPQIVLAGDSTVTDHAGWGGGFAELLKDDVHCVNMAKSGRSSRSFRSEGWWQKCLDQSPQYLLIQFGHNDQPGKGPARESAAATDFRDHLRTYVEEARRAGIRPVLVTSLTRRRWDTTGKIIPTLDEYAEAAKIVAMEKKVPLIDLHALSIEQCHRLGPLAFRAFEPMSASGVDHTHLNAEGSRAVAKLVAAALIVQVPELKPWFAPRELLPDLPRQSKIQQTVFTLHETTATITIRQRNATVLVYNKVSPAVPNGIDPIYRRSGFLHPVMSPAGQTVTATFPFDHPHQHGIFTAWVRTKYDGRELDFWNIAGRTAQVLHQRVLSTFKTEAALGFEVDLIHQTVEKSVVDILRERWRITVQPTDGSYHCFDLQTTQQALTDKPLTIEKYHYGGVALRGPVRWLQEPKGNQAIGDKRREPSRFVNDHRSERVQGNHQHAKWVSLVGQLGGKAVSITVLCHNDNFRSPQAARLHPTKPYFCFSACVDGAFDIDKAHPYIGSYRYLVTDSEPDPNWLDKHWKRFNNE